jgi:hypothetical protein
MSGGDVVYIFSAQVGDSIDVNVAGDWQTSAYLMAVCDTVASSCVEMSPILEVSDTSSAARLSHVFSTAGAYYLVVDGIAGECGTFHLTGRHGRDVTAVPTESELAGMRRLSVSPNPSYRGVRLSGDLLVPDGGLALISVFDAAGRRIWRTSVTTAAGKFEVPWDGRTDSGKRLPNGTYLIRAELGREVATTRLVHLE